LEIGALAKEVGLFDFWTAARRVGQCENGQSRNCGAWLNYFEVLA
jgi:hypothetical protein